MTAYIAPADIATGSAYMIDRLGQARVSAFKGRTEALATVKLGAVFATEADRDAFVARFPKYVGVRATTLTGIEHKDTGHYTGTLPYATVDIYLTPNETTGEVNETGLKRIRKMLEVLGDEMVPASEGSAELLKTL